MSQMNQNNPNVVFVGGISWKATEADLLECFSKYGEVVEVKVVRDKYNNNQSKGYGFVLFKDNASAERVRREGFISLLGKTMNVGDAYRGGTKGGAKTSSGGQQQHNNHHSNQGHQHANYANYNQNAYAAQAAYQQQYYANYYAQSNPQAATGAAANSSANAQQAAAAYAQAYPQQAAAYAQYAQYAPQAAQQYYYDPRVYQYYQQLQAQAQQQQAQAQPAATASATPQAPAASASPQGTPQQGSN